MSVDRVVAIRGMTMLCFALIRIANLGAAERPAILLIVFEENGPNQQGTRS